MNIYYVKMLLFTFLINTLILPHYEYLRNNHYNVRLIQSSTQRTTSKSRLLTEIEKHNNPHYYNDPELKKIIDQLNEEAIKKYQQTHDPYEQLREVVEKNGTKIRGEHAAEPMSTLEKDLLDTYEEIFHEESHMLKSGRYPNDDDKTNEKSSSCECTDINNTKLTKTKGKDKYLKHLKHRCSRGICTCSVGSLFLTLIGLAAAKKAALAYFSETTKTCVSSIPIFNMFNCSSVATSLQAGGATCATGISDIAGTVSTAATTTIFPFSIAIYVLITITVILIILYIWLYIRRKNSWKHECKKHLCK